ncbi:putative cell cycle serine/threonine-protein kinase CDC5 like protein [Nosema granulosis]|uniref:Serine/threonine-protein kinase n=1 Tax=Nosema granulosis TaxID=83296 RepID=A0A9P6L027_9MICR|nr:putative cell cycle serine/threonine-protein kinase CDC5 like protein [Nosema granulosis]
MSSKVETYFQLQTKIIDPESGIRYTLIKLLGRGAYAQCFLVDNGKDEMFAMKIVKKKDIKSKKVLEKLESEIEIHSKLNHPNIVKIYRHFRNDDYVFMLLELCERGALDCLLKRNGKLKERYVVKFVKQIVGGLLYLHNEMNVVHRDLKLGNLFLDSKLNIKIGDFGLSAMIKNGERKVTMCGTPNYIAPEVLFGKASGHSYEADVWSLGVIIYTLLIGVPPFQKKNVEEIYKMIKHNNYIFPEDCNLSSEAIDLITKILTTNPLERPTLEEILEHKLLNKKEHFLSRIYRNLHTGSYQETFMDNDHVLFSIPIAKHRGIGYVLKSGVFGFYFNDNRNIMLEASKKRIILIQPDIENGKKVYIKEEHLVGSIPNDLKELYEVLDYFIRTFDTGFNFSTITPSFIAKIRRIKDGLLFVMADSTLVFDFKDGNKAIINKEGDKILCYKNQDVCKLSKPIRELCIQIIRSSLGK